MQFSPFIHHRVTQSWASHSTIQNQSATKGITGSILARVNRHHYVSRGLVFLVIMYAFVASHSDSPSSPLLFSESIAKILRIRILKA
jgi:hypothetical protein